MKRSMRAMDSRVTASRKRGGSIWLCQGPAAVSGLIPSASAATCSAGSLPSGFGFEKGEAPLDVIKPAKEVDRIHPSNATWRGSGRGPIRGCGAVRAGGMGGGHEWSGGGDAFHHGRRHLGPSGCGIAHLRRVLGQLGDLLLPEVQISFRQRIKVGRAWVFFGHAGFPGLFWRCACVLLCIAQ